MSMDNVSAFRITTDSDSQFGSASNTEYRNSIKIDQDYLRERRIFLHGYDEESMVAISAYKSLRTHMLREMEKRSVNSLVITGTSKGVGKSLTAANLAVNIARHQDKNVLLVDLDLRAPSVASLFGLRPQQGIDQVMRDDFQFHKAIVYPDIENLSILPCVHGHQNSSEILLSRKMTAFLTLLKRFDNNHVVIFDGPPVLGCDDIPALGPLIDLGLVVIGEGETNRRELKQTLLSLGDIPLAGVVVNKSTQDFFKRYYY